MKSASKHQTGDALIQKNFIIKEPTSLGRRKRITRPKLQQKKSNLDNTPTVAININQIEKSQETVNDNKAPNPISDENVKNQGGSKVETNEEFVDKNVAELLGKNQEAKDTLSEKETIGIIVEISEDSEINSTIERSQKDENNGLVGESISNKQSTEILDENIKNIAIEYLQTGKKIAESEGTVLNKTNQKSVIRSEESNSENELNQSYEKLVDTNITIATSEEVIITGESDVDKDTTIEMDKKMIIQNEELLETKTVEAHEKINKSIIETDQSISYNSSLDTQKQVLMETETIAPDATEKPGETKPSPKFLSAEATSAGGVLLMTETKIFSENVSKTQENKNNLNIAIAHDAEKIIDVAASSADGVSIITEKEVFSQNASENNKDCESEINLQQNETIKSKNLSNLEEATSNIVDTSEIEVLKLINSTREHEDSFVSSSQSTVVIPLNQENNIALESSTKGKNENSLDDFIVKIPLNQEDTIEPASSTQENNENSSSHSTIEIPLNQEDNIESESPTRGINEDSLISSSHSTAEIPLDQEDIDPEMEVYFDKTSSNILDDRPTKNIPEIFIPKHSISKISNESSELNNSSDKTELKSLVEIESTELKNSLDETNSETIQKIPQAFSLELENSVSKKLDALNTYISENLFTECVYSKSKQLDDSSKGKQNNADEEIFVETSKLLGDSTEKSSTTEQDLKAGVVQTKSTSSISDVNLPTEILQIEQNLKSKEIDNKSPDDSLTTVNRVNENISVSSMLEEISAKVKKHKNLKNTQISVNSELSAVENIPNSTSLESKDVNAASIKNAKTAEVENITNASIVPTPKRKGRPKKSTQPTPQQISPVLGKRKRASINYAAMNEGNLEVLKTPEVKVETIEFATPPLSDTSTPKRRGRPRKNVKNEEAKRENVGALDKFIKVGNLILTKKNKINANVLIAKNETENKNNEKDAQNETLQFSNENSVAENTKSITFNNGNNVISQETISSIQESVPIEKATKSMKIIAYDEDVLKENCESAIDTNSSQEMDVEGESSSFADKKSSQNISIIGDKSIVTPNETAVSTQVHISETSNELNETNKSITTIDALIKRVKGRIKSTPEISESVELTNKRTRKRKFDLTTHETNEDAIEVVAPREEPTAKRRRSKEFDENEITVPNLKRRGQKKANGNVDVHPTPENQENNDIENVETPTPRKDADIKRKTVEEDPNETVEKEEVDNGKNAASGGKKRRKVRVGVECENEPIQDKTTRILMTVWYEEICTLMKKCESEDLEKDKEVPRDCVKCAMCRKVIRKNAFSTHKLSAHNNLAWAIGNPELDLKDVPFVFATFHKMYLAKRSIRCHKCNTTTKSAFGFLSHVLHCGRGDVELEKYKMQCPHCKIPMWPYSLPEHVNRKHVVSQKKVEEKKEKKVESIGEGRKRAAAQKANALIQSVSNEINDENSSKKAYTLNRIKIDDAEYEKHISKTEEAIICIINNCNHESKTLEEAQDHFKECKFNLENSYSCKFCDKVSKSIKEFNFHLASAHKDSGDGSDYEDREAVSESESESVSDNNNINNKNDAKAIPLKYIHEAAYIEGHSFFLNHWCYKYQLEFCEKNYNTAICLFSDIEGKWCPLDAAVIKHYLPKLKLSMPVTHEVHAQGNYTGGCKSTQFKKYKLFESNLINDHNIIFCGGPISAMAWAPTPYTKEDSQQILAITVYSDPQRLYSVANMYSEKGIIQFWNYDVLNNKEKVLKAAKLEFCLTHDYGPVWTIEWCPSGCHTDEQLGLMAVSGSDSVVYGYRIPQIGTLKGVVYKANPIFKLVSTQMTDLGISGINYYATRISWSKAFGHQYICVGYSNGLISVFDLDNSSELLHENIKGVEVIYPYVSFHAHNTTVSGVALYHMHGGNRWLASCSFDRTVKFWNLEDVEGPISSKNKCQVSEMVWLNNWISTVDASDDWNYPLLQATNSTQLRELSNQYISTLMFAYSSVNTISASDWTNTFVQGSIVGEVIGCIIKHLAPLSSDVPVKRFYMSNTRLITMKGEKIKDFNNMGQFYDYETSIDNTKLAFMDYDLKSYKHVMKKSAEQQTGCRGAFEKEKLQVYPIKSVTSVRTNPNRFSFLYTAVGYQTGFVRLIHSKFLS